MPQNALFSFLSLTPDDSILDSACPVWGECRPAVFNRLWSGDSPEAQTAQNHTTTVTSIWTNQAVYFRFQAVFDSLNLAPELGPEGPLRNLWDFDVVEVFLKPAGCSGYFEIEVSPLAQWVDLFVLQPRVEVDWDWRSKLETRVSVNYETRLWQTILKLPFDPMRQKCPGIGEPEIGWVWRINLFRAAGKPPERLYFTWSPTYSEQPDFHVPEAFGNLIFVSKDVLE